MDETKDTRFKPGHPGYKKPGDSGIQKQIRTKVIEFLNGQMDSLQATFEKLSDKEKVRFIAELLPYAVPRQKELSITDNTPGGFGSAKIDYTKLPKDVLDKILEATNKTTNEDESGTV